ncbi:type II secretion system F family protein [Streptomyces sp. NBC_00378]|uniref:type II secretion system F family protein n=1 Tax=unclassified Streptomyces TaxID=2593676 RepID=UPI00224D6762|nr:type II secretion system F family protein [Streptomyces sp. NBC_00378]MCX5115472.1 type II secretion system F family protein [Streptomyces sp. NBC_00378]WTB60088.1 type II secretion system F family protein [Streptomyces sp. NBC_00826]WTB60715.1 type II secretion system F family protein [Streptomyces sp. NBC_00826]
MSLGQLSLLGFACGVLLLGGLALIWRGWRPGEENPSRRPSALRDRMLQARASMPDAWARRYRWIAIGSGVATVAVWVATGRPVHGLIAGAVVLGLPWIWHPASTSDRQIERLEGLAEWLQQLVSVHEAGTSLEQAIRASAARAPLAVREPVRLLSARLRAGVSPAQAYTAFGEELRDGDSDNVVLLFLSHIKDRGDGLGFALSEMSELTAARARALRTVDADRAKVRTQTRWVGIISLILAGVFVFNPDYGAPFWTAGGQLFLIVCAGVFVAALVLLRVIASAPATPRLLVSRKAES